MTETNPDALQNIRITLFKNNQTIILQEGTDYRIEVRGGNGQWYEYIYTVLAKNFADDGVYRLTFYSEDAAGNIAENTLDTKKQEIGFGVDKTKPNMVVTNLESDTTYPLENLTVSLSAGDNLLLQSVVVSGRLQQGLQDVDSRGGRRHRGGPGRVHLRYSGRFHRSASGEDRLHRRRRQEKEERQREVRPDPA